MTVKRMPRRSATRPIRMPPTPEPIHISAPAKAGTERSPLTSAAMLLSATMVIHGAPKATAIITSTALATTHDLRVSTDENVDCSIARHDYWLSAYSSGRIGSQKGKILETTNKAAI